MKRKLIKVALSNFLRLLQFKVNKCNFLLLTLYFKFAFLLVNHKNMLRL